MIDRELYLPTAWTEDRERCTAAGIPDEMGFATKPQLGVAMLERAHTAGVLIGWVSADEVYGQNPCGVPQVGPGSPPAVIADRI